MLFQFDAETNHLSWYTSKRIYKADGSRFFLRRKQKYRVIVTTYANLSQAFFYLNENAAKHLHLHLDPCKVTQLSHELYAT